MPYAEYGAWDSGERVGGEMKGGERTGEAGVLHTHLYGDGYTLLVLQSEQSADAVAQGQSADVVEHHYEHHEKSAGEQFPGVVCNDDTNKQHYCQRRECRQVSHRPLCKLWHIPLYHEAHKYGQDDNL